MRLCLCEGRLEDRQQGSFGMLATVLKECLLFAATHTHTHRTPFRPEDLTKNGPAAFRPAGLSCTTYPATVNFPCDDRLCQLADTATVVAEPQNSKISEFSPFGARNLSG